MSADAAPELLLAAPGIDVNAKDKYGFTALMGASRNGYAAVVELLLAAPGIDVNELQQVNRALLNASEKGHAAVVTLLREWKR